MDANELQMITIECVKKLQNINLRVIAEVTDMGTDYQRAVFANQVIYCAPA